MGGRQKPVSESVAQFPDEVPSATSHLLGAEDMDTSFPLRSTTSMRVRARCPPERFVVA